MAIDFNALRARKGTNLSTLQTKLEAAEKGSGFGKKDDRIWKPTMNKDNKSSNIIRLLPIPYVDEVALSEGKITAADMTPMARILRHSFQGKNGWYIENCLLTFNEECPVAAVTRPQWGPAKKNNDKALQEELKKQIPKTDYYVNIQIIKDGTNPENNGKVKLYQFGETIRNKIDKCAKPDFDTQPVFDPFDMFEGADLQLNLTYDKKKIGDKEQSVPNFDAVTWAACAPACGGDEAEMERVWKESHSIAEFYNRKNFKTFDELKARYEKVMGDSAGGTATAPKTANELLNEMVNGAQTVEEKSAPEVKDKPVAQQVAPVEMKQTEAAPVVSHIADVSDEMEEFERLLNGG